MLNKIYREVKYWTRSVFTKIQRFVNDSDYNRWSQNESLIADWDSRTLMMSDYIKAESSVLEFGAGRMVLKAHLPTGCKYTPSDIVSRGEGTIVCDLNKVLPKFEYHNYIIFSGVLEYVKNIDALIQQLKDKTEYIICSYSTKHLNSKNRTIFGWINNHTNEELLLIFKKNAFQLKETNLWNTQTIYVFQKRDSRISID